MKNYFVLAAFFLLAAEVSGQHRTEKQVAARVAAHKAVSAFSRFTPFAQTEAPTLRDALIGAVVEDASFMVASVEALAGVLAQPPEQLTLEIPTADGLIELDLVRAEMYSPGFSLVTASADAAVAHTPGAHYRGIIAGQPSTLAAISIFPDEVMGFVGDATGNHVLGKLEGSTDEHIYYADRDLIDPPVFECHTSDVGDVRPARLSMDRDNARTVRCVNLYWEVNHDIYLDKGGLTNTLSYITGLFNQHATLFDNDGISVLLSELYIWDVPSPYTGGTGLLGQFQNYRNSFNGDLAHLLGYGGSAGVAAGYAGLCASELDNSMCYSVIDTSYNTVPTYSWSVLVVTHEEGHLLGSRHTQACVWNGNDTAIDGCGPYEGSCSDAPIPANGGTIMSYCHQNAVGINFTNGFGPQPATLMVNNVDTAACVTACGVAACPIPSDLFASNVTVELATLNWTVVSGAISYTLQWKPSTSGVWTTLAGITATSHGLTGLADNASYDFRVLTVCADGSSWYSNVSSFTTPCLPPGTVCDDGLPYTENDIIGTDCMCAGTPLPGAYFEIDKVVASDRDAGDKFGISVAISGDYAIVGAILEDEDAFGDSTATGAGSAYVFVRSGGTWTQQQKIVASDRAADDKFGISVAIDGEYAIVGAFQEDEDATGGSTAHDAGSAYIFHQSGGTWTQQQKIVASDRAANDHFGWSVSISGDHAIVGARLEDEDASGGNTASGSGSAYVFVRTGGTWTQQQKIVASDRAADDQFGTTVAISGDHAIVGAHLQDGDAASGDPASNAGAAYTFARSGSTWTLQQKIVASDRATDDQFGTSVAISGDHAIVGARGEDEDALGGNTMDQSGSAYIFTRSDSTWTQLQKIVALDRAGGDAFGNSVAISGDHAIVGAYLEDEDTDGGNTAVYAGSVYIFVKNGGNWIQHPKIVASDRAVSDNFGYGVAISGDHAIVGAFTEDEDEFGTNTLDNAGSAYFLTNDTALVDISTGLELTHTTTDLLVFPVPTSDVLNVVLPDTRPYRADVIGMDGRLVLPLGAMRSRTPVDVSTLTAGAYLLRLTSAAYDVRHLRFVKE